MLVRCKRIWRYRKTKRKNLPSPGAGWLGKLGLITARKTLFETLDAELGAFKRGLWTMGTECTCMGTSKATRRGTDWNHHSDNPAALLTLQSRRLLLERNNRKVTGYRLLGGDFSPEKMPSMKQWPFGSLLWKEENLQDNTKPKRVMIPANKCGVILLLSCRTKWFKASARCCNLINQLQKVNLLDQHRMICFSIASVQYGIKTL